MADSYDDFLNEGGGGGTATGDDDSYAEFLRQQRQDKLAQQRAAQRTPAAPPVGPPALDLAAVGLSTLPAGAPVSAVPPPPPALAMAARTMVPPVVAPSDVTRTPASEQTGPGLASRLALEQESPDSFSAALAHPGPAALGLVRGAGQFAIDQGQMLRHPVAAAEALGTAAVTAPYRALHGVGGLESSALERLGIPLPVDAQFGPSASEAAGGLFDTALLTEPAVGAIGKGLAMGRDAMYTAAAGEARYQSALERAQADAMAARARKGAAGAPRPADGAPLALPPGQYDLPAGEYSTRDEPETDPSRLLTDRAIGAGVPTEGPAVTAPIGMPAVDWQSPLNATKATAADASAARQQGLGLPRALLAPSVEEQEGAARAAEVSGVNRELRASPEEVDTYRLTRDAGISPSMREIGRPTPLPGETDAAYAARVANRVGMRDQALERSAITEEGSEGAEAAARAKGQYSSARTASGAARPIDMFPKMTDDALHAHMADLIDNQMGTQRGALNTAQSARLNAAEAELEARGHTVDDIWTTGLERGRSLNAAATAERPSGHFGFTAAGPLAMIVGTGVGAGLGAALAPPGKRGAGAAAGALSALGLVTLGTAIARDGRALDAAPLKINKLEPEDAVLPTDPAERAATYIERSAAYSRRGMTAENLPVTKPILSGPESQAADVADYVRRTDAYSRRPGAVGDQPGERAREAVRKKAITEFGTTDDPHEAGWLLPDGQMLDFSEKEDGGQPGVRSADHRQIGAAYDYEPSHTAAMHQFRTEGNVRFSMSRPNHMSIDVTQGTLTEPQFRRIKEAMSSQPSLAIDVRNPAGDVVKDYGFEEGEGTHQDVRDWLIDNDVFKQTGRPRYGAIGEQPDAAGAGKTFPERLYSRSQRAIEAAPFKKGTAEQWAAVLGKNVGQDERAALTPFLEANRGKTLSKVDVLQEHARTRLGIGERTFSDAATADIDDEGDYRARAGFDDRPKFGQWVEPGGTNYREHVLTYEPAIDKAHTADVNALEDEYDAAHAQLREALEAYPVGAGENARRGVAFETAMAPHYERIRRIEDRRSSLAAGEPSEYTSEHWPEVKNPLVHVRLSDRELPSGEKALHVEEIQSDWHQAGREEGYQRSGESAESVRRQIAQAEQERTEHFRAGRTAEADAAANRITELNGRIMPAFQRERGVPDAPFKKTPEWTELGLKKVIDEAVRGKYDRVTLPTGDQMARRFQLSRRVDELRYTPEDGKLYALNKGRVMHEGNYTPEQLREPIGKEVGERLMNAPAIDNSAKIKETTAARDAAEKEAIESRERFDWVDGGMRGKRSVAGVPDGAEWTRARGAMEDARRKRDNLEASLYDLRRNHGQKVLTGESLNVGGEGQRGYYDQIVPNVIKDYSKKLGVKIDLEPVSLGKSRVTLNADHVNELADARAPRNARSSDFVNLLEGVAEHMEQNGSTWQKALEEVADHFGHTTADITRAENLFTKSERELNSRAAKASEKNLSFKITPELRAKVLGEGQRVGAADPKLIKTLGLAALGAAGSGLSGNTPGEHLRNAALGLVAGGAAGAVLSRDARALSAGERAELGARATMERPAAGAKEAADAITATFAPQTRGEMAATAGQTVRAARGKIEREAAIAQQTLDRVSAQYRKLPIGKKLGFMDAIEAGRTQADKALQPLANTVRRLLDEERDRIRGMGTGKLDHFIENYFPHLWQDEDRAGQWLTKILGKRPMEGSKSFLKQRTIPTVLEGMFPQGVPKNLESMTNAEILAENRRQGGLVPVTFDPVEATMLKLREMKKYRMAQEVIGDLGQRGLLKPIQEDGRMPVGYARIGDWAFSGKAAPEPVARVLNNYLSPGLRGNAAYDAYMAIGNTLNQAQLGFSAFHAGMTTIETMVSQNALALEHLVQGKAGQALKEFATFPAAPFRNYQRGEALRRGYLSAPGTISGPIAAIADGAAEAGARYRMDVHSQASTAFRNALEAKQYARAAKQLLPAMMEKVMGPVMNELVPRQKMGIFYDLAESELARLGPEAHPDEVTRAMQRAWDSVDNRMGQVVYDNLFWNKTAKDLFHASVRSVGWNWGTFNELGGGTKDLAGFVKDLATPGKASALSHRAAYALALPMTLGMLGAVTQYLYTGKGPESMFDMFHPKTGTKDADGNDNRVVLPSYMKDVYGFGQHPVKTITNKMNPLLSLVADGLLNKDFYGDEIYDTPDFHTSFMQSLLSSANAAGQLARYGAKATLPFGVENLIEDKKRGAGASEKALAFVGITPASREAVRSRAQNLMHDALARRAPQLTPEEASAAKIRADLRDKVRTQGAPAAMAELRAHLRDGTLTRKQVQIMLQDDQTPALVKHFKQLTLPDAEAVFRASTSDREKKLWLPILEGKRARAGQ